MTTKTELDETMIDQLRAHTSAPAVAVAVLLYTMGSDKALALNRADSNRAADIAAKSSTWGWDRAVSRGVVAPPPAPAPNALTMGSRHTLPLRLKMAATYSDPLCDCGLVVDLFGDWPDWAVSSRQSLVLAENRWCPTRAAWRLSAALPSRLRGRLVRIGASIVCKPKRKAPKILNYTGHEVAPNPLFGGRQ